VLNSVRKFVRNVSITMQWLYSSLRIQLYVYIYVYVYLSKDLYRFVNSTHSLSTLEFKYTRHFVYRQHVEKTTFKTLTKIRQVSGNLAHVQLAELTNFQVASHLELSSSYLLKNSKWLATWKFVSKPQNAPSPWPLGTFSSLLLKNSEWPGTRRIFSLASLKCAKFPKTRNIFGQPDDI
jgi:hypothetical protein